VALDAPPTTPGRERRRSRERQHPQMDCTFRPDLAKCRGAIELCEGDPNLLLLAASAGVTLVRDPPALLKPSDSPEQLGVLRLTIAFLALAEVLGIGKEAEALIS
jgi:hypothetical protein